MTIALITGLRLLLGSLWLATAWTRLRSGADPGAPEADRMLRQRRPGLFFIWALSELAVALLLLLNALPAGAALLGATLGLLALLVARRALREFRASTCHLPGWLGMGRCDWWGGGWTLLFAGANGLLGAAYVAHDFAATAAPPSAGGLDATIALTLWLSMVLCLRAAELLARALRVGRGRVAGEHIGV